MELFLLFFRLNGSHYPDPCSGARIRDVKSSEEGGWLTFWGQTTLDVAQQIWRRPHKRYGGYHGSHLGQRACDASGNAYGHGRIRLLWWTLDSLSRTFLVIKFTLPPHSWKEWTVGSWSSLREEESSSPEPLNRVHAPDLFVYNCYILN